jgi:exosortase F-associated protein
MVRLFEKKLFYDPLLDFYQGDFLDQPFPDLEFWRYNLSLTFRYLLNTSASLFMIWVVFKSKNFIKFSLLLFAVLFVIGILLFWFIQHNIDSEHYMRLFYVRRFIIQPLLVIILLPAFYFQKLNKKSFK